MAVRSTFNEVFGTVLVYRVPRHEIVDYKFENDKAKICIPNFCFLLRPLLMFSWMFRKACMRKPSAMFIERN